MAGLTDRLLRALADSSLYQQGANYYRGLDTRDRRAVNLLGGFLLVAVLVFGILLPAHHFSRDAMQRFSEAREDLNWMRAQQPRVAAGGTALREPGQSLLTIANKSAAASQLDFSRYEPVGDNGLNLWLDGVPFTRLVSWLENLQRDYGVAVRELSVRRQETPGVVDARLLLED